MKRTVVEKNSIWPRPMLLLYENSFFSLSIQNVIAFLIIMIIMFDILLYNKLILDHDFFRCLHWKLHRYGTYVFVTDLNTKKPRLGMFFPNHYPLLSLSLFWVSSLIIWSEQTRFNTNMAGVGGGGGGGDWLGSTLRT